jgi:hypothetical protein
MERMKFHWEKNGKTGFFLVEARNAEECIQTAKEEAREEGAELTDWYSVSDSWVI